MLRLVRACMVAGAIPALTVACGSSGKPGAPAGGSGGEDAGQTTDAGAGTSGNDSGSEAGTVGTGGASGGGGDAGVDAGSADTTPPVFSGAKAIDTGAGEDHVVISWDPATDPPNAADQIAYRVYRSPTSGGEDYSRAHRCGDPVADASTGDPAAVPCYLTTGTGATEATVRGAAPNETLYYVVRAIDAAGNEDKNTSEVFGATPDATAPDFGGVRSIDVKSATSFEVKWGAAFDLGTPVTDLTFNVYVSASGPPDPKNPADLAYSSAPGERSHVITGLPDTSGKLVPLHPSTQYQVMVRAVDSSQHEDTNKRILGVTTPEGVPPTFGGLKTALAESDSSIRLFWLPGTDNDTPPASIVYDVYYSFSAGKALTATPVTTPPGASSFLVEGLEHGTGYHFVVRARDFVGNTSGDTKEVTQSTLVPDTIKPTFAGADTVTGSTPTSLSVTWTVANDDTTQTASNFRYLVYVATSAQVPITTPVATLKGVTSTVVTGLSPGTSYNVVVLAEDEAGNVSDPPAPTSGITLAAVGGDTGVAPTLSGTVTATQVTSPATRLSVSWPAATDDNYTAANIRYHLCASVVQSDCQGASFAKNVNATTAFGTTTISLVNLSSHSSYYVYVRAEDKAGNVESVDHFAQQTTATSWGQDVLPIIRDKCIACHYNGSPLHAFDRPAAFVGSLSTYTDTTGKACLVAGRDGGSDGCQLQIVDRFRPEFSYLYRKINAAGLKTPPFTNATNLYAGLREPRDSTEPLGVDEDQIILSWIAQGALGN